MLHFNPSFSDGVSPLLSGKNLKAQNGMWKGKAINAGQEGILTTLDDRQNQFGSEWL
jgi:hypothetical protein